MCLISQADDYSNQFGSIEFVKVDITYSSQVLLIKMFIFHHGCLNILFALFYAFILFYFRFILFYYLIWFFFSPLFNLSINKNYCNTS
jgi:hypothetical protein